MVLESLFSARKIESKPVDMFLLSAIISFASVAMAYIIFPEYAGVAFPLLITVGMAPVLHRIIGDEEMLEEKEAEGKISEGFFQRYGEIIWLFFGGGIYMSARNEADVTEEKKKTNNSSSGQAILICEHKQMVFGCPDCDAWYWKYFENGKKGTH